MEGINRSRSKEARYGGETGLRIPEWRDCEPLHHKLLITPVAWPKDEGVGRSQAFLRWYLRASQHWASFINGMTTWIGGLTPALTG